MIFRDCFGVGTDTIYYFKSVSYVNHFAHHMTIKIAEEKNITCASLKIKM